jgi:hypothetical protein
VAVVMVVVVLVRPVAREEIELDSEGRVERRGGGAPAPAPITMVGSGVRVWSRIGG